MIVALAIAIAVVTAVRSTWSPCGVSMLSSITPLSERGRGRRFGATASWFLVGAVAGGATLGSGAAALAFAADQLSLSGDALLVIAAACALVSALADAVPGVRWPRHTRQVNDVWITRYRGWVCGTGFGWQIGVGLATFIVTPAVYLLIALNALTAAPRTAFAVCVLFGLVRGLAIFAGRGITSPEALVAFHRRFERLRAPVRRATIVVQLAVAVAAATAVTASTAAAAALAAAFLAVAAVALLVRRAPKSPAPAPNW
jgi:hypothetical protein